MIQPRSITSSRRVRARWSPLLCPVLLQCLLLLSGCTSVERAGDSPDPATATPSTDASASKEGGSGVRAKGEEGALGAASVSSQNKRHAVQGPRDAPELRNGNMWGDEIQDSVASGGLGLSGVGQGGGGLSRSQALNEVRTMGMIGLTGSGTGSGAGYGATMGRVGGANSTGATHQAAARPEWNTEQYAQQNEADFVRVGDSPLSTFSVDVDTASYANVRRLLRDGAEVPEGAVRVEEFLNYFSYEYPEPSADTPFGVYSELTEAPWNPTHKVLHVGISTKELSQQSTPARNLVFLLDVSGSMSSPDKLPLVQKSMELLARQLREQDHVGIVVYAGASGVVLDMTSGSEQGAILAALSQLQAGGGTNGAQGIEAAYALAHKHFKKEAINRVILATDGDFNIGRTSESELVKLIERERQKGVFLTVLGVGRGNLKDTTMEMLADKGNGNYAYLDSFDEARKVLEKESGATLVTVAKDVKLQIEFNPQHVAGYRLIGYDNRRLAARDFNDDSKDAGEIGAGHTVTALYEIIPAGQSVPGASVDPLKYQKPAAGSAASAAAPAELATLKIRYKAPLGQKSQLLTQTIASTSKASSESARPHRLALAVAEFALLLQNSKYAPKASYTHARALAAQVAKESDTRELQELVQLIALASKRSGG